MTTFARTAEPSVADPGVEGNSRLTAATGVLLIAMLALEGLTILSIRGLITWHIFVGIALIGPVALKTASTIYRFTRYYTGRAAYVRKGPPHPVLRVLGPLVILSTIAVLATGIALVATKRGGDSFLLFAHKASFVIWIVLMSVHVLGHLLEAATASWQEIRPQPGDPASRHRATRSVAILLSLAVGIGGAAVLTPHFQNWTKAGDRQESFNDG